ncbi:family 78 glycoside hydrolase catalytic domain [Paenibacillus sp. BC26]|uniref:family 78 glycoside hydrolase catalytic domain n=1 Tax=Paenibacillus sp. BC26 TaxID=1881032 RepID=UPI0008F1F1D6|nr:family 78 glycoside hydrolase catalytic domain [Paenibacillus sp. BC26]SFS57030.1 Alpha-L-rhamnosidase N-terminal domain-containing protein [Paenibacillus sp. BC26]
MTVSRFARKRPDNLAWGPQTGIIWHPDEVETHYEHPMQSYCYFRRCFELPENGAATGTLNIFADSKYMLYVNGVYAGRGPCRSDPRWQYVDELDVTGLLRPGRNVLAVIVLYYGYGTGQSIDRIPALAAELRTDVPGNAPIVIGTDSSWSCRKSDAYDAEAPRVNGCQGPVEVYDAGRELQGWQLSEFSETDWQSAKMRGIGLSPFWNFLARPIPLLEEKELDAVRLASRGSVSRLPAPTGRLHVDMIEETKGIVIAEEEGSSVPYNVSSRGGSSEEDEVLTYDFGRIEPGYLQLEVTGTAGTIVDVVYAEELWEGKAYLNLNNNRSMDRFILAEGRQQLEVRFGWKACRFVQLRIRHADSRPICLHRVGIRTRRYPVEQPAVFRCSDQRLQQVWEIAEHTIRICMQDAFVDSPSREQQQWMGDGRWQALYQTIYSGDGRLHRKLLEQIGQSQDWQGMTAQRYPDGHHNYPPIPSFCLHWINSFGEYVSAYGNDGLLTEWWPNIIQALRWFSGFENDQGLLEDVPYWAYIDAGEAPRGRWPDVERGGIVTSLNLLYLEAMQSAAIYAEQLRDTEAETHYKTACSRLADRIRHDLWNPAIGAYADCRVAGALSDFYSESCNALGLVLLHEAEDERSAAIYSAVFAPEADAQAIKASPFFMMVVFRALLKLHREERLLELVRERYGKMIDAGATSVWEWWELFYENESGAIAFSSASHAWGSMPVYAFIHVILGIRPLKAANGLVRIKPLLPEGMMWAEGSVPTAFGVLTVRAERRPEQLEAMHVMIDVPKGAMVLCGDGIYGAGQHAVLFES